MARFNLRKALTALVVSVLLTVPFSANAVLLTAALTGSQEVPPVTTDAFGVVEMWYDVNTDTFDMLIRVYGIPLSDLTASHIHLGPPGQNGPVIVNLGGPSNWVNGPAGTIQRQITGMAFPAAKEADLLSHNTYVNVHTLSHPMGEIRGQLCVVPEPASLIALGVGLAGLALRRRRA